MFEVSAREELCHQLEWGAMRRVSQNKVLTDLNTTWPEEATGNTYHQVVSSRGSTHELHHCPPR
jgi:hypothetical protein